jgi:integrase
MSYQFVREPLNVEEMDRMVNACRSFQEKLIVWVLLDTGLRVHEFCALRRDHVQWQENCLVAYLGTRYQLISILAFCQAENRAQSLRVRPDVIDIHV